MGLDEGERVAAVARLAEREDEGEATEPTVVEPEGEPSPPDSTDPSPES